MLSQVCPASVELIHQLIKSTETMSLKECLVRDFQVIEHMVVSSDFKEGVRCVLMEKGAVAKWSSPDLHSLKKEQVEVFLSPIEGSMPLLLEC